MIDGSEQGDDTAAGHAAAVADALVESTVSAWKKYHSRSVRRKHAVFLPCQFRQDGCHVYQPAGVVERLGACVPKMGTYVPAEFRDGTLQSCCELV